MGLYTTVRWMRGIDYGTRRDGCAAAWKWSRDNDAADGCEAGTFNGGAEANERLVVFAQGSSSTVYADHAGEGAAVLDPLAMIFDRHDDGSEARFDAALEAFCAKHGLPWREPRWLLTVDVS